MIGYYAPDTNCYYEGANKGAENHVYVGVRPTVNHILNTTTYEWYIPFEVEQKMYLDKVTAEREQRLEAGFNLGIHTIRADNYSMALLLVKRMDLKDGIDIFPFDWRTIENVYFSVTDITLFNTLVSGFNTFMKTTYDESYTVKDAIELATTIEEVETLYGAYING